MRDVLQEDEPERDVLVVGRLHVAAQLVGRLEHLGLETEVAAVAVFRCIAIGHIGSRSLFLWWQRCFKRRQHLFGRIPRQAPPVGAHFV